MIDLRLKKYIDQLIILSPGLSNKLAGIETLSELIIFIDNLLVPATDTTDGLLSAEDKHSLDMLVARPNLNIIGQFGDIHGDILNINTPDFNVRDDGFRTVTIESPSYKYNPIGFQVEHIIQHSLKTMDLNITVRTRDLGEDNYSQCFPHIEFLDNDHIKVTFTRAENPFIFVSKL